MAQIQMVKLDAKTLDQVKQERIDLLNSTCDSTILAGFTSAALGEPHVYQFEVYDQMNLTQQMILFLDNPGLGSVYWKTEDAGVLPHTREQFGQLALDAEAHKRSNIARYWDKKAVVLACPDEASAKSVTWESDDAALKAALGL